MTSAVRQSLSSIFSALWSAQWPGVWIGSIRSSPDSIVALSEGLRDDAVAQLLRCQLVREEETPYRSASFSAPTTWSQ